MISQSAIGWEMARQGFGLTPMIDDLARMFPEMVLLLPPSGSPLTGNSIRPSEYDLVHKRIAEFLSQSDLALLDRAAR